MPSKSMKTMKAMKAMKTMKATKAMKTSKALIHVEACKAPMVVSTAELKSGLLKVTGYSKIEFNITATKGNHLGIDPSTEYPCVFAASNTVAALPMNKLAKMVTNKLSTTSLSTSWFLCVRDFSI